MLNNFQGQDSGRKGATQRLDFNIDMDTEKKEFMK